MEELKNMKKLNNYSPNKFNKENDLVIAKNFQKKIFFPKILFYSIIFEALMMLAYKIILASVACV